MANESVADDPTGTYAGGIPLNVTLHAWPVPGPVSGLQNETGPETVGISESANNYTNSLSNLNATGFVAIEDDLTDTGFTDVQTFILAGIATVIPLVVIVATILGIRFVWRRYKARKEDGYEGVLQKEESVAGKLHGYTLPKELKTSESQFTVTQEEEQTPRLPTPKSNGSIITMTLKNNHLIVETEETANTSVTLKIESKGTTTKYVTPGGHDFKMDPATEMRNGFEGKRPDSCGNGHGALVHCPPEGTEEEEELDKGSCNTGLSQSDLSVSSAESQNPSYRYGNQSGYESGAYGYAEYSGYGMNVQKEPRQSSNGGKNQQNRGGSFPMTEPTGNEETDNAPFKTSAVRGREKKMEEDEESRYQEEQTILGNGEAIIKRETGETDENYNDDEEDFRSNNYLQSYRVTDENCSSDKS